MKVVIVKDNFFNIKDISKENIFVIAEEEPLYKFIENLKLDSTLLYNLRIINEIDFTDKGAELRYKGSDKVLKNNIQSLSELISFLEKEKLNEYTIVFDTEDVEFVSRVIQSFIYLNLSIEVNMKNEKTDRKRLEVFRKGFNEIKNAVQNIYEELEKFEVKPQYMREKRNFMELFSRISKELDDAKERELNVAMMATKKAGKSAMVNSFLNEQYVPTSLEIPTANTCIYKQSKDNSIRMKYGQKEYLFKNPRELYKFMFVEFKKTLQGVFGTKELDDMKIFYAGENNSIIPFTIIDTPGSNYIQTKKQHNDEDYTWLEKSDVVVFLINYSNYLAKDEEEFLKVIKTQFKKYEKFYSLIIVVNKLDQMFNSECENKSLVRFLDMIRFKLNELGYKGFVVVGTSARTYSDVINVENIDKSNIILIGESTPIQEIKGAELRKRIKVLKGLYIGKTEMSSLNFVEQQLENLECFFGLKEYSLDTLREWSGIPKLKEYTRYVAVKKGSLEIYRSLIKNIDEKYMEIENKLMISKLTDMKKENAQQIREIEQMLHGTMLKINGIKNQIDNSLSFKEFKTKLGNNIKEATDKILQHAIDIGEARIDDFFMKLMLKESEELKLIKNGSVDFEFSINHKIFNGEIKTTVENAINLLKEELDRKEKYVREANKNIREILKAFVDIIRREYSFDNFEIILPEREDIESIDIIVDMPPLDINDDIIKEKIRDVIEIKETPVQKLVNISKKDKEGNYQINSAKLRNINKEYVDYVRNHEYDEYYDLLRLKLFKVMDDYKVKFDEEWTKTSTMYKKVLDDMMRNAREVKLNSENSLKALEEKLEFYRNIEKLVKSFEEDWKKVR